MVELLCFSVTGYINLPCCSFFCIILNNVNAIDFSERFFPDSILSTQKEGQMSERPVKQTIFVPTPPINRITTKQMLGKISVSPLSSPGDVCGIARRVGYTGKCSDDLATYRLKIRMGSTKVFETLPSVFVVDDGVFLDYNEWRAKQQTEE
jgi:hypothetical protein